MADDEPDYQSLNEPNEAELMAELDRYLDEVPVRHLPAPGAPGEATLEELLGVLNQLPPGATMQIQKPYNYESPLERDLRMAAQAQQNRRRNYGANQEALSEYQTWRKTITPATDLERRIMGLSDAGKQAFMEGVQRAAQQEHLKAQREAKQIVESAKAEAAQIISPDGAMSPFEVDAKIDAAWSSASDLPHDDQLQVNAALELMQAALMHLRRVNDPVCKGAVVNLEMAAIGAAMRGQRG